jgi:HAD superfamily hydrolase (TIGR01549 family)
LPEAKLAVVAPALEVLVGGVELLGLDAGNTVIFLDHARIAGWLAEQGLSVATATLVRTEGEAKRLQETDALLEPLWEGREAPGARGWGRMLGTTIARAGIDERRVAELLPRLWKEHAAYNLYSRVPEGLGEALDTARAAGVRVVIISNSEGMLETLFDKLGILRHFDAVLDSAKVGVEKPDRRIFEVALARFGVPASRGLHLGDTYATDIVGAEGAGMRAALIDPYGHYDGLHPEVPRVSGVVEVALALAARRSST